MANEEHVRDFQNRLMQIALGVSDETFEEDAKLFIAIINCFLVCFGDRTGEITFLRSRVQLMLHIYRDPSLMEFGLHDLLFR